MILDNAFLISTNGLFDFDLTFLSEALLFLILSISVTNFFLLPISKQIEERNAYINCNVRKMDIIISLTSEKFQNSIQVILEEIDELVRQTNLVKNYTKNKFEKEIQKIETENKDLINKAKGSLIFKSAESFKLLNTELNQLTDSFFQEKFTFE